MGTLERFSENGNKEYIYKTPEKIDKPADSYLSGDDLSTIMNDGNIFYYEKKANAESRTDLKLVPMELLVKP